MRQLLSAGPVICVLGLLFMVATALAVLSLERNLGLKLASVRAVKTQINLTALQHGVIAWSGLYETDQPVLDTWHRFPRLAAMELEEGARSTDQCLKLSQVDWLFSLGRQTSVRLCAAATATRIYFSQRLYWRP